LTLGVRMKERLCTTIEHQAKQFSDVVSKRTQIFEKNAFEKLLKFLGKFLRNKAVCSAFQCKL